MPLKKSLINVLLILCVGCGSVWAQQETQVVVLANAHIPESLELAQYYMQARHIPARNLCVLDLPRTEVITREDYKTRLTKPLLAWLRTNDFVRQYVDVTSGTTNLVTRAINIRYLVSMYGVPVRISSFSERVKNRLANRLLTVETAAVDSELCLLLHSVSETHGPVRNPLFARLDPVTFRRSGDDVFLLCTRLDGPDAASVKNSIDGALYAERYGLQGSAWFDTRGLSRSDSYFAGDHMIEEACERFKREGYVCHLDKDPDLFSADIPMKDAAIYFGWYTLHLSGPFKDPDFRFVPGALAYHIHSSSARLLRTSDAYWAGPLIDRGAAVTMGAVAEPFLRYMPNLALFSDRLCRGFTLGESAYMALPVLSWQITVIGDPLYRPFRYSLDEQIDHLRTDHQPALEWAILRKVNLLLRTGQYLTAKKYCEKEADQLNSTLLQAKLKDLF